MAEIRAAWLEHLVVFFRGPAARARGVPGLRPPHRQPVEYPFVKGLEGSSGDHRDRQVPARDGELRRHLAQRHRVPRRDRPWARCWSPAKCPPSAATPCGRACTPPTRRCRPAMHQMLDGLRAVSSSALADVSKTREDRHPGPGRLGQRQEYVAEHPVVRTHPGDGAQGAVREQWRTPSASSG